MDIFNPSTNPYIPPLSDPPGSNPLQDEDHYRASAGLFPIDVRAEALKTHALELVSVNGQPPTVTGWKTAGHAEGHYLPARYYVYRSGTETAAGAGAGHKRIDCSPIAPGEIISEHNSEGGLGLPLDFGDPLVHPVFKWDIPANKSARLEVRFDMLIDGFAGDGVFEMDLYQAGDQDMTGATLVVNGAGGFTVSPGVVFETGYNSSSILTVGKASSPSQQTIYLEPRVEHLSGTAAGVKVVNFFMTVKEAQSENIIQAIKPGS